MTDLPVRTAPVPIPAIDARRRAAGTALMTATRLTARGLARGLTRLEVTGLDHVPRQGGALLAVNHAALVDGPIVYGLLPRPAVFLVKVEAFVGPIGLVLRHLGQLAVRRGTVQRGTLQGALDTLAAGGAVGVFPEGSRGAGDVATVQRGIAYLALRSGCPVVPVACHGTAALLPPGSRRPAWRPPVRIAIGEPLTVPNPGAASRAAVTAAAEAIRVALAAHVASSRPHPYVQEIAS